MFQKRNDFFSIPPTRFLFFRLQQGAENLRKVSTDKKSSTHVADLIKKSNVKLDELKSQLEEIDSQLLLSRGGEGHLTDNFNIAGSLHQQLSEASFIGEYRTTVTGDNFSRRLVSRRAHCDF